MPEAVVIVTRLKENQLEVLTTRKVGPTVSLPTAKLAQGEHPCEGALRALDAALGSDACQAFRKLTTRGGRHYFVASPETADESSADKLSWTPLSAARHVLGTEDVGALDVLE